MYSREKRVLLREYMEQGWSKSSLAEKLGVSRRTIYHWVATGQLDRDLDDEKVVYRTRSAVKRKIDRYKGIIHSRLTEYPELSAVRLLEEIRSAGYQGGYSQLAEYVHQVRPAPEPEPVVRFETPAGHQAQVDFAHFKLPWGVRWALVVVLSYSRMLWLRFFHRQDMNALMSGLEQAFRFFGGVPAEALFDQMRSVVTQDNRESGGRLIENLEFLRFANHWGFRPRVCRPYRAKTKGKVERPIRYVRENFFYGREFISDADLDAQLSRWIDEVANVRVHRTTNQRPVDRFEHEERMVLQPLAARPYRRVGASGQQSAEVKPKTAGVALIEVERRPLTVYSELMGGQA